MTSQWSYGDKGNKCSMAKHHTDDCDGDCARVTLPDSVIDVHNELLKWDRSGMSIRGVPTSIANVPFLVGRGEHFIPQGVHVEMFLLEIKVEALKKFLVSPMNEEEFEDQFRKHYFKRLQGIRERAEKEKIAAKANIIIPNVREIKH
jgi:hypothetical protein